MSFWHLMHITCKHNNNNNINNDTYTLSYVVGTRKTEKENKDISYNGFKVF